MGKNKSKKLHNYSVADLKKELKKRNACCNGKKHELVDRLKTILDCSYMTNSDDDGNANVSSANAQGSVDKRRLSCSSDNKQVVSEMLDVLERKIKYLTKQKTKINRALAKKDAEINNLKEKLNKLETSCNKYFSTDGVDVSNNNSNVTRANSGICNLHSNISKSNNKGKLNAHCSSVNTASIDNVYPVIETNPHYYARTPDALAYGKKVKILLLGDGRAKRMGSMFRDECHGNNFDICVVSKPYAQLESILSEAGKLTNNFTKEDYLVIFGGSENAVRSGRVKDRSLDIIKGLSSKVNVIFISVPYWKDRMVLNNIIYEINSNIYSSLEADFNIVSYIDINSVLSVKDFVGKSSRLKISGKIKLVRCVLSIISHSQSSNNEFVNTANLVYPPVVNNCSENVSSMQVPVIHQPGSSSAVQESKGLQETEVLSDKCGLYPTLPLNDTQLF